MCNWVLLIKSMPNLPSNINLDKYQCYYAREYKKGGWKASASNSILSNYKKSIDKKNNPYEWNHKKCAIEQFANELSLLFEVDKVYYITFIPSSKTINNPLYDNRMELTIERLKILRPRIQHITPIVCITDMEPSHHGGSRNPIDIKKCYKWVGMSEHIKHLIIIDDVLTSGAHFTAYAELIEENLKNNISLYGVFWARTV